MVSYVLAHNGHLTVSSVICWVTLGHVLISYNVKFVTHVAQWVVTYVRV